MKGGCSGQEGGGKYRLKLLHQKKQITNCDNDRNEDEVKKQQLRIMEHLNFHGHEK